MRTHRNFLYIPPHTYIDCKIKKPRALQVTRISMWLILIYLLFLVLFIDEVISNVHKYNRNIYNTPIFWPDEREMIDKSYIWEEYDIGIPLRQVIIETLDVDDTATILETNDTNISEIFSNEFVPPNELERVRDEVISSRVSFSPSEATKQQQQQNQQNQQKEEEKREEKQNDEKKNQKIINIDTKE